LFRHQAEPGRELPAVLEAGSIAHGCDQGGCRYRADAFDLSKPQALLAGPGRTAPDVSMAVRDTGNR
jgi:hypothetical protein